jgi:hypothetical protein
MALFEKAVDVAMENILGRPRRLDRYGYATRRPHPA